MRSRVFSKLLLASLVILALCTAVLDFSLRRIVQHSLVSDAEASVTARAQLAAAALREWAARNPAAAGADLESFAATSALNYGARITLTDPANGLVVADSGPDARTNAAANSEDGGAPHLPATSSPEQGFWAGWAPEVAPLLAPRGDSDGDRGGGLPLAPTAERSHPVARGGVLYVALPATYARPGAPRRELIVRVGSSLAPVRQTLHLLRRDLLLASAFALLCATLLVILLARRVGRRLRRIVLFAHRIAAGDLSARVEEGRLDEISEVAHALDATAVKLEASFRALESSRRELAALLDSMQQAVVGVDASNAISWSNAAMRQLLPCMAREGRPLVECARDPELLTSIQSALLHREPGRCRATSFLPGRVFEGLAAPMPNGGAVLVLQDVTDVERSEKMRRDFVANVSHELRTPLTSISGYVETVLDTEPALSEYGREYLEIVLKNAYRMNRLTEDLLALARVEAGDYRLHTDAIPAAPLIEETLTSLGGLALDSGVSVEVLPAPELDVLADPDAITQVFANLLENAMKYGRSGGKVEVGARRSHTSDSAPAVEFFVRDYGPGIASEHHSRLFERFYRVDKARSRESGGTGLGLSIARHIVRAHGGELRLESELGAGATFLFTLPVPRAAQAVAAEPVPQTAVP